MYKRKTTEKWKADTVMIAGFILGVLVMGFAFFVVEKVRASQEFLSPLSDNYAVWTEVEEIEVPVNPESVEEYLKVVFGNYADEAMRVAECESGIRSEAFNGDNRNGSVDSGVFQINSIHGVRDKWLKNPFINIQVAKQLFDESGESWSHWYSSIECHGLE